MNFINDLYSCLTGTLRDITLNHESGCGPGMRPICNQGNPSWFRSRCHLFT